ncbi:MAG: hypothetical protein KIS73_20600 [Enhydrobacter sp.]|nr:hypothetical protein [Enhydrobacter sp.]
MAKANQLSGVRKWLEREEWAELFDELLDLHLGPPCDEAGIEVEELADVIGAGHAANLFGCVLEDMLSNDFDDGSNIVDDYLKRRGWKESVPNKRYMMALRSSVMSLYEVSDIVPDRSFLARDLLRGGEPVRVSEKLATRSLKPWDVIAARVLTVGTRVEMSGGVLPMDRELAEALRKGFVAIREKLREEILAARDPGDAELDAYGFDTEALRRGAFAFTHAWLEDVLQRVLDPIRPALNNSDGDPIEFMTVRYPLKPGVDRNALGEGIGALPGFRQTADDCWNWAEPPAAAAPHGEPGGAQRFSTFLPDGSVSLGDVGLEGDTLVLRTNSPQRAERARALLDPVIGPFVAEPAVEAMSVEEMMKSRPDRAEPAPSVLPPDEERALLHDVLERHYRGVLEQPVPALGGVSPRACAGTPEGRERLVGWLKALENGSAKREPGSALASYDMSWMWEELGVSHLRR